MLLTCKRGRGVPQERMRDTGGTRAARVSKARVQGTEKQHRRGSGLSRWPGEAARRDLLALPFLFGLRNAGPEAANPRMFQRPRAPATPLSTPLALFW